MNRSRSVALAAAAVAAVAVPVVLPAAADATPVVRITKIHYGQSGTNLNTEYIVFKNTTGSSRSIKGWKIVSAPASDNQYYVFPATKIPAHGTLTLYTGHGTNGTGKRYWNANSPRWNNDGDKAVLKNSSGGTVDSCQYAGGGTTYYC